MNLSTLLAFFHSLLVQSLNLPFLKSLKWRFKVVFSFNFLCRALCFLFSESAITLWSSANTVSFKISDPNEITCFLNSSVTLKWHFIYKGQNSGPRASSVRHCNMFWSLYELIIIFAYTVLQYVWQNVAIHVSKQYLSRVIRLAMSKAL